jgi:hypothetical protein
VLDNHSMSVIMVAWVDRHVLRHVVCCAKALNHAHMFSLQSNDNLNLNYLHHPSNYFVGAIFCTFMCLE